MDLYSRKVVGESMRDRLKAEGVHKALQRTLWKRKPSQGFIWHTDQGHLRRLLIVIAQPSNSLRGSRVWAVKEIVGIMPLLKVFSTLWKRNEPITTPLKPDRKLKRLSSNILRSSITELESIQLFIIGLQNTSKLPRTLTPNLSKNLLPDQPWTV